ncbi:MBL fold metallo-hydrolase [Paenibacillus sp. HJGM_3]|uniref:MBL fold metallo-hydrolase n=1 Tax=Paenibacillus sp. HJGM_3 TaxID=3379816 RepID=UPI003858DDA7
MRLQLVRHATLWLEYAGVTLLIDPMFSEAGANPPIANSGNERRNPLVPLPAPVENWLQPDVILVTHLHQDHWDRVASAALSKDLPVLCQPGDEEKIASTEFASVLPIHHTHKWEKISITRTGGQHGTGEIGRKMGNVSGFVLQAEGEPTLYVAGDTIWCDDVKAALDTHRPDVAVVNAGGARFVAGDPITMDAEDVASVRTYAPYTQVIAVHMDTINHCLVTREELRRRLAGKGLLDRTLIPEDGEWV